MFACYNEFVTVRTRLLWYSENCLVPEIEQVNRLLGEIRTTVASLTGGLPGCVTWGHFQFSLIIQIYSTETSLTGGLSGCEEASG